MGNGTAVENVLTGIINLFGYAMGVLTYDLDWMQVPLIYWIMGFIFLGIAIDYILR